mmetsp:Transcript_11376/g.20149  ORF Transcript_11376/g.20149 Transcript_11376/m.20149 type:complete len:321 (+) Transcript_11376:81-1043(+)|eukprot:CAMPEP_0197655132 /NCGR_PEP_ID=MMETSP1338-20131121/39269_1 /TAXON_ID=43686 ORGANISM="Pelagodinium beii, Strain RCC1491" /NCGR_SAMPLE_ID=MMETSP1338 /ASSEMBLY_ACC=CAM_ASM_000754 /LENGTH=320 /DNA_ID=CAMNT_0043230719 /DNA_START=80 /DNA_END=1042 /DNA_ORIENTATION=+
MSGRVFFTPQAGRTDRSKNEDEPWGTTSSQSHFKPYEPSEARSARSSAAHVKPALEGSVAGSRANSGTQRSPVLNVWERNREDYRDPSAMSQASAVTISQASSGSRKGPVARGGGYIPAAELVAKRPIPERPFRGVSHYKEQHAEAQEARHEYFPYRDEYHPRSKRLLYEMALNKVKADHADRGTAVADEDTRSCFTLASSAASAKSRASRVTSLSRASSMPSQGSRLPTADSLRVSGGLIGAVAKRRKEAAFRSAALSEADRAWFAQKYEEDGPVGLSTGNFPQNMYEQSLDKFGQGISAVSGLLGGSLDNLPREKPGK